MAAEEPNLDAPAAQPPSFPQWLLPWVARADRVESIAGDLLEAYRDIITSTGDRRRANAWYDRQVAGMLWRLTWPFGLLVAAQLVTRGFADTLVPPENYQLRSSLSTWGAIYGYIIAGAISAWRTRQAYTGAVVGFAAHVMGHVIAIGAAIVLYITVIRHDAQMLRLFEMTGGWDETLGLPIFTAPFAALFGWAGGLAARLIDPRRSAETLVM